MGVDWNLAIETSSRAGSVSVGRGGALIASVGLGRQRRHAVGLMPQVDAMAKRHGFGPGEIGEVYVSIGPGSFTGLRIAVTAAKVLARAAGSRVVAVPTLDVVAANAPAGHDLLAVCLNAKGGRCFAGLFRREGNGWRPLAEPSLLTPAEVAAEAKAGGDRFAVLGDHLPEHDWPAGATLLDAALAVPRSEAVWRIGRAMAEGGAFTDAYALRPLYVRLPDAEEKWRAARG